MDPGTLGGSSFLKTCIPMPCPLSCLIQVYLNINNYFLQVTSKTSRILGFREPKDLG